MFDPSIAKAAAASPLWPHGPEEATRILQACVVAWPGVAWHGGILAEGPNPKPKPTPPPIYVIHRFRAGERIRSGPQVDKVAT